MNIDQYMAMKKQEETQTQTETTETKPTETIEEVVEPQTQTQEESKSEEVPIKLVIDGEEYDEAKVAELKKLAMNGTDYYEKVSEVERKLDEAKQAQQFYDAFKQNPALAQKLLTDEAVANSPLAKLLDTTTIEAKKHQDEVRQLKVQLEIEKLQRKHGNIDVAKVIRTAIERELPNLETAYELIKSQENPVQNSVDIDAITKQIEDKLRAEFLASQKESNTDSMIGQRATAPSSKPDIVLTAQEQKIAKHFKMTPEEFAKYKN